MLDVYNFCITFVTLMSGFATKVIQITSTPVYDLIDKLPQAVQTVAFPALELMQKFGVGENLTLLGLMFGTGFTIWVVWALVEFFNPLA